MKGGLADVLKWMGVLKGYLVGYRVEGCLILIFCDNFRFVDLRHRLLTSWRIAFDAVQVLCEYDAFLSSCWIDQEQMV